MNLSDVYFGCCIFALPNNYTHTRVQQTCWHLATTFFFRSTAKYLKHFILHSLNIPIFLCAASSSLPLNNMKHPHCALQFGSWMRSTNYSCRICATNYSGSIKKLLNPSQLLCLNSRSPDHHVRPFRIIRRHH